MEDHEEVSLSLCLCVCVYLQYVHMYDPSIHLSIHPFINPLLLTSTHAHCLSVLVHLSIHPSINFTQHTHTLSPSQVHSEIRWRRVCAVFDDHPLWRAVHPEERKDVYDDVVFALAEKEKVSVMCVCVCVCVCVCALSVVGDECTCVCVCVCVCVCLGTRETAEGEKQTSNGESPQYNDVHYIPYHLE